MPTKRVEVNAKIWNFLNSHKHRILLVYGGAGSGKSYTVAQWIVYKAIQWPMHALITRKHNPSLMITALPLVRQILDDWGIPYEFKKAEQRIIIGKSELSFRGLDDPEKIKSAEYNFIWLEEATEFHRDDFMQLKLRLRRRNNGRYRNQMVLTFNPISMHHWIYEEFFLHEDEEVAILHTNYRDNLRWLPPDYIKELERLAEEDEYFYKVYTLGQFAVRQGLIYDNWETIPDREADEVLAGAEEVFYGLDFGYNNPTALLKMVEKDGVIYIVDELYMRGLTNADLIQYMADFVKPDGVIYADSAEPARIEEIQRHGYNVIPADKSVKDGIDFVKRHKIRIAERCVNTIKEIRNYKWKEDHNGNILDEPVKYMDHAMDAMRYAVYTRAKQGGAVNVWWI
jgi:phage terminase large subunit